MHGVRVSFTQTKEPDRFILHVLSRTIILYSRTLMHIHSCIHSNPSTTHTHTHAHTHTHVHTLISSLPFLAIAPTRPTVQLIEDVIREHLGWLIVWGNVFGGTIGLVAQAAGYGL